MGEPALADVALVPEVFGPDDPDWMLGSGQLDYAAEARLINENLLDLSHVSFVHQSSIKGGPAFSEALPNWEKLPRGLRYSRWMTNVTQVSGGETRNLADAGPVDEFLTYDFLIPGILVMYTGVFPQGTAVEFGHRAPDRSRAIGGVSVSSQAVTPMRDRSTRYFFSAGPSRAQGTEAIRQLQVELAQKAFAEDKVMIEAQQRVIDKAGDTRVIPTAHDKPITLFNAMVQRLDGIASNPEAAR
jgi:vanillate O-demethylase monooxygenase subunit